MLIIVVNLLLPFNTKALTEGKPSFINFSTFSIQADSTLSVGDTISIQFDVTSLVADSATVYFHTTIGLHILNNDSTFYKTRIMTDTNSTQNIVINILVDSIKFASYSLFVVADQQSLLYENSSTFTGGVYPIDATSVMEDDPYDNEDLTVTTMQFSQTTCPEEINHHIKIKGKVTFLDWGEAQEFYATGSALENYPRRKSPLTTAWIFFRDPNNPTTLTHPIPFNQTTGLPIEGIHFAKCIEGTNFNEEAGEFTFEFDYNPLAIGCQTNENMTVEIYIAKENETAILNSGSNNYIVSNFTNPFYSIENNPVNTLKLFPSKYFSYTYTNGVPENIDISYQNINSLNIEIPWDEGAIFRYSTLSREFLKDIYNNLTLNFTNERIRKLTQSCCNLTWREYDDEDPRNNPGGNFVPNTRVINIYKYYNGKSDNYANCKAIAHEFGHFFDEWMPLYQHNEEEAFALFFSYAANVWMHNNFGDLFTIWDDCEIGPFAEYLKDNVVHKYYPNLPNEVEANRFGNITKLGVPDVNTCRFACYLWNIYDSKSDQPFSPISEWDGMANDDVENLGEDLMNFWLDCSSDVHSFKDFHNYFIANYSSNERLQNSIKSIYDFMDYADDTDEDEGNDDYYANRPIENISARMIGPNISGMDYTTSIDNNQLYIKFSWGVPINFNNIPFEYIFPGSDLEEKIEYPFQNLPFAMKLFHNDTNQDTWSNIETVTDYVNTQETDWYLVHDWNNYCNFKLSTVNINDEESNIPLIEHMGISQQKIGIDNNDSDNRSLITSINIINQTLSINSSVNIKLKKAILYDLNGKIIEELNINNDFASYHIIKLNEDINILNIQILLLQLNYLDYDNNEYIIYYKFIK